MPHFIYKDTRCNGDTTTERWLVCALTGEGCKEMACSEILDALAADPGGGSEAHEDENSPGFDPTTFIPGLGFPFVNRPCEGNVPGQFLRDPDLSEKSTEQVNGEDGVCCRTLTLTFQRPEGEDSEPPDIDSEDPDVGDWCPTISINTVETLRAQTRMPFGGIWQEPDGSCCSPTNEPGPLPPNASSMTICGGREISIGECVPPQASNGQLYDPAIELESSDEVISIALCRVCRPGLVLPPFTGIAGKTNCAPLRVRVPCRCFDRIFGRSTIRYSGVRATTQDRLLRSSIPGVTSRLRIWCLTLDMVYRPEGWDVDVLNHGTKECVSTTDPADPTNEITTLQAIEDAKGYTSDHLECLGDNGRKLAPGENKWFTRWWRCCIDPTEAPGLAPFSPYISAFTQTFNRL